jgi:hypothetical protein
MLMSTPPPTEAMKKMADLMGDFIMEKIDGPSWGQLIFDPNWKPTPPGDNIEENQR